MNNVEQRRCKRISWGKPVVAYPVFPSYEAELADSKKKFFRGLLRDLSDGGMGLDMGVHLVAGSILKFRFKLNEGGWIEIFGKVAWSKDELSGVKFLSWTGIPLRTVKDFLAEVSSN